MDRPVVIEKLPCTIAQSLTSPLLFYSTSQSNQNRGNQISKKDFRTKRSKENALVHLNFESINVLSSSFKFSDIAQNHGLKGLSRFIKFDYTDPFVKIAP